MDSNFAFNSYSYDFWEVYEVIKKYYPIGIDRKEKGVYHDYSGIKELKRLIEENIGNKENYNLIWKEFSEAIGKEIGIQTIPTSYGNTPSYSCSIILKRINSEQCNHSKIIHFSKSLLGNFYQIYATDETSIQKLDGKGGYVKINVVTTSPFEEYKESFEFIEKKINDRFPNHKIIPFSFGQNIINGLNLTYVDNKTCSVNMALFNHLLNLQNVPTRGEIFYGMENWRK